MSADSLTVLRKARQLLSKEFNGEPVPTFVNPKGQEEVVLAGVMIHLIDSILAQEERIGALEE